MNLNDEIRKLSTPKVGDIVVITSTTSDRTSFINKRFYVDSINSKEKVKCNKYLKKYCDKVDDQNCIKLKNHTGITLWTCYCTCSILEKHNDEGSDIIEWMG